MAENSENQGDQSLIMQGEPRPLPRLPDESDQAYAAKLAYCKLPPDERSVTAAFRAVKGESAGSKRRAPGRYFAWAKRFDWAGAAVDWDAYLVALPAQADGEDVAAVHQTEVVQAAELQELIALKMTELRAPPARPAGLPACWAGWADCCQAAGKRIRLSWMPSTPRRWRASPQPTATCRRRRTDAPPWEPRRHSCRRRWEGRNRNDANRLLSSIYESEYTIALCLCKLFHFVCIH